ncbi:hypothetical protein GCM10025734_81500 [Kitasatospora paranensis]
MGQRVTIRDVAARAGVSAGAVSLAFNDRPGVSARTRERIIEAARELGWSPSLAARSLARGAGSTPWAWSSPAAPSASAWTPSTWRSSAASRAS